MSEIRRCMGRMAQQLPVMEWEFTSLLPVDQGFATYLASGTKGMRPDVAPAPSVHEKRRDPCRSRRQDE